MSESEVDKLYFDGQCKDVVSEDVSAVSKTKHSSTLLYTRRGSVRNLSKTQNNAYVHYNKLGSVCKLSKRQNTVVTRDTPTSKSFKDFSRKTHNSVSAPSSPLQFMHSSSSGGVEGKTISSKQQRTSNKYDSCVINTIPPKPFLSYFKGHLAMTTFHHTHRPNLQSHSGPNRWRVRTISPLKNQTGPRNVQCLKTAATSLQFQTYASNNTNLASYKNIKFGLTAWAKSREDILQSRSTEDLSALKEAVARSPPHSLIQNHFHYNKGMNGTMEYFRNVSWLQLEDEDIKKEDSSDSIFSSFKNVSSGENGTDLSELFSSDDTSKSDQTRGIWSKLSVSDSQRTSLDLEWESCLSPENPTVFPYQVSEQAQYKQQSNQDLENELFSASHMQQRCRQRLKQAAPQTLRLLKRRQQQSFQAKSNLCFEEVDKIENHTFDFRQSSQAFQYISGGTHNLLATREQGLTLHSPSDSNILSSNSSPSHNSSPKAAVLRQREKLFASKLSLLRRAASYPNASVDSEKRFLRYIMMSQIMQKLLSLQDLYQNHISYSNLMCPSIFSSNKSSEHVIIRTDMRKIICGGARSALDFRSFRCDAYYVWKWRLFVVLILVVVTLCISFALLMTFSLFCC